MGSWRVYGIVLFKMFGVFRVLKNVGVLSVFCAFWVVGLFMEFGIFETFRLFRAFGVFSVLGLFSALGYVGCI